jgi:transposase
MKGQGAEWLTDAFGGSRKVSATPRIERRMEIAMLHRATIPAPQISWFTDRHRRTVGRWVVRVGTGEPITDRPRSGRPALFGEETHLKTIAFFCQTPALPGCTRWTLREAERHFAAHPEAIGYPMSRPSIARVLVKHALRPHLRKYFLQTTDPEFFPKMDHLIGLYTDPPEHLFCFDECTGVQALERLTPTLPATIGHPLAKEFEYRRHGTTDVIAFLTPSTGDVFCRCTQNHTAQTLIRVFTEHVERQPRDAPLHYICDNLSTHFKDEFCATVAALSGVGYTPLKTGMERRLWLQSQEKRIALHFTPFHGSWLNMVEIWFGILGSKCLKDGSFASLEALIRSIDDFARTWSEYLAHPFTWTYRGEGLHGKVVRRFIRLLHMESSQMEIRFLTKQLQLMANMIREYLTEVDIEDWEHLHALVLEKHNYLDGIIAAGPKEPQRAKAGQALQSMSELLDEGVVQHDDRTKSA